MTVCTHGDFIYNAAALGYHAAGTITQYTTLSYYPDALLISPSPILTMSSVRLDSDSLECDMSLASFGRESNCTGSFHFTDRLPHPVVGI